MLVLPLLQPTPAHGYAEDVANLNGFCVMQFGQQDCNHSTFHYDLVRDDTCQYSANTQGHGACGE